MMAFHNAREAKEFLISKIVAEAQLEGIPLSEIERKMLYFSESGWTLPDIVDVCERFDREYGSQEYERKIAKLIRKADKRVRKTSAEEYESWWSAIRRVQKEDHYILVMIRIAGLRPKGDRLRLLLSALAIVTCVLLTIFLPAKYNVDLPRHLPTREALSFVVWISLVSAAVVYSLFRFIVGGSRTDQMTAKMVVKLVRIWQRNR